MVWRKERLSWHLNFPRNFFTQHFWRLVNNPCNILAFFSLMISTSVLVISSASPHPSFLRYLIHLFLFHFTLSPLPFDLDSNHLQMPSLISTPVLYPLMYLTSKPAYQPKKPSFVWYQIKKVSWGSHELYPGHSSASLLYLPLKIPLGDLFYAPTDSISCNVTTLLVFSFLQTLTYDSFLFQLLQSIKPIDMQFSRSSIDIFLKYQLNFL